jgi:hypothetical protein
MKLLNEIIDLLSTSESALTDALLKTKVLLYRLGEKQLLNWVDSELQGYGSIESLPNYRKLKLNIKGNSTNGSWSYSDSTLPTLHLPKNIRDNLENHNLVDSIATIESYAKDEKNIGISIAPEYYALFSKALNGYTVTGAYGNFSAGAMIQVLTEVRSRLLEFVLEISDKLPNDLSGENMKLASKKADVSGIFQKAVFGNNNNFGNNNTFIIGNDNVPQVTNSVINNSNNFESLAAMLRDNKINEADIQELKCAIDSDGDISEKPGEYGSQVTNWIESMLSKAASNAWDIEKGVAGSLIATALSNYYGIGL